jgi:mannose-6-phosphate isomerase-like protein (cupin superfamily)
LTYPGGRGPLQLLTPDLQRQFEVTEARDKPGQWHTVDRAGAEHEEFAFVVEGTYEIEINEDSHVVGAGDSFYLSPVPSYRFRAIGDTPARAIWIAIPPAF